MKIKPRIKIGFIVAAVLILTFAFPLTASAQTITGEMSGAFGEILSGLAQFLTILLKVLQRILWPIFLAIGGLLNNDILFGYGMEQRLLEVWVQIRNYVNILFVVALLGVALFNVLAINPDSDYALKKFLPKFAIALIAVNFSYIAMKIVLDVTNVATTAIFTLPSAISSEVANPQLVNCPETGDCTVKDTKTVEKICQAYYGTPEEYKKSIASMTDKDMEAVKAGLLCETEGDKFTLSKNGKEFFRRYNSRNAGLVMAIQFMDVMKVDEISSSITKDKFDVTGLAFNLLFSVILYVVYGAAYIALFVVLLTRLVVLWLFIALSPLVALKFALPNLIPDSGDIQSKFFKNAFAPILMGIPLTIGYIILEAFRGANTQSEVGLGTAFNMVKLEVSGMSDLQSMIIAFAAVAVVWLGVFSAAEGTIAGRFTEQIKQGVQGLGASALKGLKMIPLIPAGPGGKGLSFYQATSQAKQPWENLMEKYGPGSSAAGNMSVNEIKEIARKTTSTQEEGRKAVLGGLGAGKEGQVAAYNLLQQWNKRGAYPNQQRFAKGVLGGLSGAELKEFEKGNLSGGTIEKLRGNPFLKETTPVTAQRTAAPPAGTAPTGAPPAATGQNEDMSAIGAAIDSGYLASDSDVAKTRDKWTNARVNGDQKAMQDAEADLKGKYKDEVSTLKNVAKSNVEVQQVQTSAGGINVDKPDKNLVDGLKKALATADASLSRNGVTSADKRKEILGKVLQKATGGKASTLVGSAEGKDIGNYVKV